MFNISKFLDKFFKNIESIDLYKKQILEIIKKETQLDIPNKDIEIKNNIVYLKTSSAISNKIFIYKSKILEEINEIIPIKIIDIR